jgi:hypothetical protein
MAPHRIHFTGLAVAPDGSSPSGASSTRSPLRHIPPRILELKDAAEIERVRKVLALILRLLDEHTEVNERKDDITEVDGLADAPVIKHESGHDAEAFEGEVATGFSEFATGDMASLSQALLTLFQCRQHKEKRILMEARFAQANLLHDAILERQLRHVCSLQKESVKPRSHHLNHIADPQFPSDVVPQSLFASIALVLFCGCAVLWLCVSACFSAVSLVRLQLLNSNHAKLKSRRTEQPRN